MPRPSIARRLGASLYEFVLLFGVFFVTGIVLQVVSKLTGLSLPLWLQQLILFAVFGQYFSHCWMRSGQTLAQKTWHIRILGPLNSPPTRKQTWLRYALAYIMGILPALLITFILRSRVTETGAGYVYALTVLLVLSNWLALLGTSLMNSDRRALHEVLSGTQSVFTKDF